jgi:hemolysin III
VQLATFAGVFILSLLAVHMVMGFVEFFFHRYVLHMQVLSFCGHFYKQHNLHHGLTDVTRDSIYVSNEYPIEEDHQHEASFFM